jgi:hypothetical protein
MAKGKGGYIEEGAGYVSYTGKLTKALKRAGDRPVSASVTFASLEGYNTEGKEFVASMQFFTGGYISASTLLAHLQAGGFRQYWRDQATEGGRAESAGGVMRVAIQFHEKWSASGTKPGKRGG